MSAFLVKVTAPNKQFFIVVSLLLELEAPNINIYYFSMIKCNFILF